MRRLLAALLFTIANVSQAGGFETADPSTFARAFALPALGRGAVLAPAENEAHAVLTWTNEYFNRGSTGESLVLDAESQRLGLTLRHGFGGGWEAWAELPLLNTDGGSLDSLIESWHSTFGLPNSNRSQSPRNRYRIQYVRNGQTVLLRTEGASGLGDIRLGAGWQMTPALVVRALVQLPTGSSDDLTGGHSGGAIWGEYTLPITASGRTNIVGSAGLSMASTSGPLGDQQEPLAALVGAALTFGLSERFDALVELNAHNKLYSDSGQAPLSHAAAVLQFGGRYTQAGTRLELGFIEDGSVNASPDFGLHFGFSQRW